MLHSLTLLVKPVLYSDTGKWKVQQGIKVGFRMWHGCLQKRQYLKTPWQFLVIDSLKSALSAGLYWPCVSHYPHCSQQVLCLALNCSFKQQLPSLTTLSPPQGLASHFSESPHLWFLADLAFSPLVLQCNYLTAYCLPHLPGLPFLENSWSSPRDKRTNLITYWTPYAPPDAFGETSKILAS